MRKCSSVLGGRRVFAAQTQRCSRGTRTSGPNQRCRRGGHNVIRCPDLQSPLSLKVLLRRAGLERSHDTTSASPGSQLCRRITWTIGVMSST
jgi:hypothetical protein